MLSPVERAYQDFANAIVKKAADDYRNALKGKGYNKKSPKKVIAEVEKFFLSQYFEMLTEVKGEYLIEKLREEYEEERNKHESNISTGNI